MAIALAKLSRNTQIALFLGGAALILHFYFQLVAKPLGKEVRRLKLEKKEIEMEHPDLEVEKGLLERLEVQYKREFEKFSKFEEGVRELEANLPSRKDMSGLLEYLTSSLDGLDTEFVSLEPTLRKAEEGDAFDSLEIEMKFYADFAQVIRYLEKLEATPTILGIQGIELSSEEAVTTKPLVTLYFSTYVSDQVRAADLKESIPVQVPVPSPVPVKPAPEPFRPEAKPYDNRLPGDHHLTMIVWQGGKLVALIDGKVMKKGSKLGERTLTEIEEDGVWFSENGVTYYLALET